VSRKTTEAAPKRRRRNPEVTRDEILAAARTVLASDGPDGLSLSKVAHLAGVNRGTAYQHFETREDLIKATVTWVSEYLSQSVFGQFEGEGRSPSNGERPIYDFMTSMGDFAVENPELGRIWLYEILSCKDPNEDVFFRKFVESTQALSESESSEEGIDAEALSVMILAGYFLWPVWVRARAGSEKERKAMSLRMRREFLRMSLHGTLHADSFPQLQALLES
jgi:AcrR family transcriptional regulator